MSDDHLEPGRAGLTGALIAARRGLRSDVAHLVDALESGELLVPLARGMPDVPAGERVEVDGELSIVPHLLADENGRQFCVVFSRPEILEKVATAVGWDTDQGTLEYCTLPARVALHFALDLVDGEEVPALVVDPGHDSELVLRRDELASIAQRRALPLVGYVAAIPAAANQQPLIAEPEHPPDPELLAAIDACLSGVAGVAGWQLLHTFDAERDLEPHATIAIRATAALGDRGALGQRLAEALEGKLPPPGYLDVLFEDDVARPP